MARSNLRKTLVASPGTLLLCAAVVVGPAGGCFRAPKAPRDLTSTDPTIKIPAITAKAAAGDRSALAQLVEDLDSDDPAVRFYAFTALTNLTGQAFDYRYYDDELERRPALAQWREWLAAYEAERNAASTAPATQPGT